MALNFKRNPFQTAIYKDQSREIRIRKSTQCGISEYGTCWALSEVDQGYRVFWVFPTDQLRNQFVHDRLDPSVNSSPYYSRLVSVAKGRARVGKDAPDAVTLKQIGYGALALIGSNSEVGFKSFAADSAIVDEVDQCDQGNLAMTKDRLANSDRRFIRFFGNPTTSGFGIDKLYADSDRKRWTIKCICGEWQTPDWFTHVVREEGEGVYVLRNPEGGKAKAICPACDRVIDRYAPGEWIAEYPDREVSGYHVSQMFSGAVSTEELWVDFQEALSNESKMQRFYNSVLGLPYEGKGAKLSEAHLNAIRGDFGQQSTGHDCYMGVDPGSVLNLIIIDGNRVVRANFEPGTGAFDQLDNYMSAYGVRLCVIDGAYDARLAQMFAERHRGKVLRCFYPKMQFNDQFDVDWRDMTVKVDRTQSLDDSHAAILQRQVSIPREAASIPQFYAQMMAPTRVFQKTSQNDPGRFVWVEGSEPDHYRHAFNYAWLARKVAQRGGTGVVVL